jgi:WD40 repeat protein
LLSATGQVEGLNEASGVPALRMPAGDAGAALWSLSYSPDGNRLITGDKDGHLTVWDAVTGEALAKKSDAARGAFLSVAYSPNGKWIISASEDCTARVYDARTLELVQILRGHLGPIHCVAAGDDYFATGGRDMTVRIWDLKKLQMKLG